MRADQVLAMVVAIVCLVLGLTMTSEGASIAASSSKFPNSADSNGMGDFKHMCDILCSSMSKSGDFCPPSCPESQFMGPSFKKRAGYRPFNDELGNLSFEDYMFLKMFGRTRR